MPRIPVPSSRTLVVAWSAVILVILAGMVILTVYVLDLAQSREIGREDRADLRQQLTLTQDKNAQLGGAVDALVQQVEQLGEEPVVNSDGVPGSPTRPVVLAPSRETVVEVVRALIDGAVLRACGGDCRGEDGQPLPPADPLPPLPPLPPLKGDPGEEGPPGRGVTRFDCVDGAVTVVYTDATRQTVPGLTCTTPDPEE